MTHQLSHHEFPFTKRTFPITLICDNITFQPNIGSLFRVCEAFGVEEIIFIGKGIALTPRKISKTSRSTHLVQPHKIIENTAEAVTFLQENNYHIVALEITSGSVPLRSASFPADRRIALIAGSEVTGISQDILDVAQQTVHIEMFGNNSSMNVVQAVAVALYDMTGKLS